MGNALTLDAAMLWRFLRNDRGWWTSKLLAHHWRPTYVHGEVIGHLYALTEGGFVERRPHGDAGEWAYAVTADCRALPGQQLLPTTPVLPQGVPLPRQTDVMTVPTYLPPPAPPARPGSNDASALPSLVLGRPVYRSAPV